MDPLALVIYGDGMQALLYDDKNPGLNRENRMVKSLLIVPSNEINGKYNIEEEERIIDVEDKNRKGLWVEYPVKSIEWLRKTKFGAVIFIHCAFDGAETPHMSYYNELLQWTEQQDSTIARLRAQVSALQRENEDMTSAFQNFIAKQKRLAEIYSGKDIIDDGEDK